MPVVSVYPLSFKSPLTRNNYLVSVVILLMVIVATVDEMANGANFSLVPHCNPDSNGMMTGIVGAMGNLGGVWFALMFRFQPSPFGKAFWMAGVVTMVRSDVSSMTFAQLRILGRERYSRDRSRTEKMK